jgi:hypothetical protein
LFSAVLGALVLLADTLESLVVDGLAALLAVPQAVNANAAISKIDTHIISFFTLCIFPLLIFSLINNFKIYNILSAYIMQDYIFIPA